MHHDSERVAITDAVGLFIRVSFNSASSLYRRSAGRVAASVGHLAAIELPANKFLLEVGLSECTATGPDAVRSFLFIRLAILS